MTRGSRPSKHKSLFLAVILKQDTSLPDGTYICTIKNGTLDSKGQHVQITIQRDPLDDDQS